MFGLNIDPNNPRGNPNPQELQALGVQMVRYTFYDSSGGDQIDPRKAQFYKERATAYKNVGVDSLVILTYDTYPNRPAPNASNAPWDQYIERFARRSAQIAQLLAPVNPAFQVWNEPDHPVKGDYAPTLREEVFGRMLRRTYEAIKQVGDFTVVTAGLASGNPSWLTTVIRSLGGQLPADAVAFHPYGQRPDPNWPRSNWGFGFVGKLLNDYYRAGQRKPLWITEMGVKEEDLGHNRERVAEFLRRYYRTIVTDYQDKVPHFQWFCYSDGMVPTFGLLEANGNRKPAYGAYKQIVQELRSKVVTPPAPITTPPPQPVPAPAPSPPVITAPPPPPPPVTTTPPRQPAQPSSQQVSQLTQQINGLQSQMQQLQSQMAQLQQNWQQLAGQQQQMEQRLRQLESRPAPGPAVAPPPIRDITDQLPRHPTKRYPTRSLEQIKRIIIHHTAIRPQIGAERIAEHRVNKQGWPAIGYHYFITGNGVVQQTNDLTTIAKHAVKLNEVSAGVCFAGDFTNATPTPQQMEAGAQLLAWLLTQLNLPVAAVIGHKEIVNTQSPGLQWDSGAKWGEQLKARIQALL